MEAHTLWLMRLKVLKKPSGQIASEFNIWTESLPLVQSK
ncbi:Hypothetical protein I595_294 [Croceitalea dokdonensis DOKDO 023]|uniref:Uncharacterized protein n=1 Tax=Croceitalea dokdonensis DOKDO 023 TaxID=1300341 RepID=A0A0P7B266_9FLAO|nr:Hypothetical protein I595_294 [Croceitalea dokdonensis DOKDO 023]